MPSRRTVLATAAVAAAAIGVLLLPESVRDRLFSESYGEGGFGEGLYGGLDAFGEGPMGDPRDR